MRSAAVSTETRIPGGPGAYGRNTHEKPPMRLLRGPILALGALILLGSIGGCRAQYPTDQRKAPPPSGSAEQGEPTDLPESRVAPAQPSGAGQIEAMVRQFDRDGDGLLSRDEAPAQVPDIAFRFGDRDGDGKLSSSELEALRRRSGR